MSKVVLKAQDLDGYLTEADKSSLARMDAQFRQAMVSFNILSTAATEADRRKEEKSLIGLYNEMGSAMQEICSKERGIQVYSFVTPQGSHGEASRLIAKLRDVRTGRQEFVYYIQRAYELCSTSPSARRTASCRARRARKAAPRAARTTSSSRRRSPCPCRTTRCTRSRTSTRPSRTP